MKAFRGDHDTEAGCQDTELKEQSITQVTRDDGDEDQEQTECATIDGMMEDAEDFEEGFQSSLRDLRVQRHIDQEQLE